MNPKFTVELVREDGYTFRTQFTTMSEARDFAARAASVLLPNEALRIVTE